ncbi:Oxygen sensor protein DosP [compost metagenome]
MAHSLRLHTVAEGVETAAQFERLRKLGCELVQGFHIAAPMAAEEARQWQTKYCHARQAQ